MKNFKTEATLFLKSIFIEWRILLIFSIPTFLVLMYVDLQNTNIGFLPLYSIDEFAFHGTLRSMFHNGFIEHNFSRMFAYGFYQYGFVYFLLNLLLVFPTLIFNKTAIAIFLPRLITSFFAIFSLIAIYKVCRLFLSKHASFLLTLLCITMPAFWFNATWFHPDWLMTFFLIISIYFLIKDNWQFNKYFYFAVMFYSFSVAFKYQAITMLPVFIMYIFYNLLCRFDFSNIKRDILLFIKTIGSVFVIFFIANPYIAHSFGWRAFKESFNVNMLSNNTNHGVNHTVTIIEKINLVIGGYYFNWVFLVCILVGAFWLAIKFFNDKSKNIFSIIAINFIINIAYLFLFVNKAWQSYYLPVIFIGLFLVIPFFKKITEKKQQLVLISIIAIQIIFYSNNYVEYLSISRDQSAPDFNDYSLDRNIELNNFILDALKGEVSSDNLVLITVFTPFEYEKVGLKYENIRIIYGGYLPEGPVSLEEYIVNQKKYWGNLKTREEIAKTYKKIDYDYDYIILRKNTPFIDIKKIEKSSNKEAYYKAVDIVKKLNSGDTEFKVFKENDSVIIYKRK